VAVAKKTGGSLMRLYRDTRFSKDKTPYKTNIGIMIKHINAANVHAPGFYVHLAPEECFSGVGTWRPEPADLLSIRQHLAKHPAAYRQAVDEAEQTTDLRVYGDSVKRMPKGFDATHPLADELRRTDFLLSGQLDPALYLGPELVPVLARRFEAAKTYMAFLCRALGADF
jgi:uncharacterized protein (TIGR02453 family)